MLMAKKKGFWAEIVDEQVAERVARIIGGQSAYGLALDEIKKRRAAGEDLVLMQAGATMLIVPRADISNVSQLPPR